MYLFVVYSVKIYLFIKFECFLILNKLNSLLSTFLVNQKSELR